MNPSCWWWFSFLLAVIRLELAREATGDLPQAVSFLVACHARFGAGAY